MSKLASLLGGMTLNDLAKEVLSLQGRRGDTELAHVNKREAALLKAHGGAGDVNPSTGMTEFYDGMDYNYDVEAQPGGFYGGNIGQPEQAAPFQEQYGELAFAQPEQAAPFQEQYGELAFAGQPTPQVGGAQSVSPPQENTGLSYPAPEGYGTGVLPGTRGVEDVLGFTQGVGIEGAGAPEQPGILQEIERLAAKYPTISKAALAAALGAPGMVQASKARKDAAKTRREMEQMAAPIRAVGQEQLAAGQRGELTATQQQQLQAARAAARQDLSRRGVTSGTAAQMAENRITEMAQRFAQTNIENGVRLIGAANSYNAAAIQQAYKMNADANTMTQNYYTNLMRAFGALPSETK